MLLALFIGTKKLHILFKIMIELFKSVVYN